GEVSHVDQVDLDFSGQITRPEFAARVQTLKKEWPLEKGMPFINESWHSAKETLLDGVSRKDFFFARLTGSQATVDAEKAKADLSVAVESGPRVRFGKLTTVGLKRVPPELIDRYIQYTPGDPYDQDKLDDWQQALQSTSFFRGAFVTLNQDQTEQKTLPDGELELPVRERGARSPGPPGGCRCPKRRPAASRHRWGWTAITASGSRACTGRTWCSGSRSG
ncbi:MAG: autotransporter assembly complex protein TamA, partial [Pollutimonas bauzanensis]